MPDKQIRKTKKTVSISDVDSKWYSIRRSAVQKSVLEVHLFNEIAYTPYKYDGLFYRLRNIPSTIKVVHLYLGSIGGCCEVGFMICQAIAECPVPVHIIVQYSSKSMGAIIALSGDSLTFKPGTYLMFHNYSQDEAGGKALEFIEGANQWHKYWTKELYRRCTPFLTGPEVEHILSDRDIYIYDDDENLIDRLERHFLRWEQ